MRGCQGCGISLEGAYRTRKWCSDRCRKQTLYSGVCSQCGGRTSGTASGIEREPDICASCNYDRFGEELRAATHLHHEEVEALWASGMSIRNMASVLGIKANSMGAWISQLRRHGANLPYRYAYSARGRAGLRRSGRVAARRLHEDQAA